MLPTKIFATLTVMLLLISCTTSWGSSFQLIDSHPLNDDIFVQGLEIDPDGQLLYSSGLYGQSQIGYINLLNGEKEVKATMPDWFFAEGVTVVNDTLWQLSWRENTAVLWDLNSFAPIQTAVYTGEGWGLAYDTDNDILWTSNGSNVLTSRNTKTFESMGELSVSYNNKPVQWINELEYANGYLYANLWFSNHIIKIDPNSGQVIKVYDLTPLVKQVDIKDYQSVLNGIAHIKDNEFYITGKNFRVIWHVLLP